LKKFDATAQLMRVRDALDETREEITEAEYDLLNREQISYALFWSQNELHKVQEKGFTGPESVTHFISGVQMIRNILSIIKQYREKDSALERAANMTSMVLAMLYPVYKKIESEFPEWIQASMEQQESSKASDKTLAEVAASSFMPVNDEDIKDLASQLDMMLPMETETEPEPAVFRSSLPPVLSPPLAHAAAEKIQQAPKKPPPTPRPEKKPERRKSGRRAMEVDIGIHSETNFFTGLSMDISSGGLFVSTYDLLPVGTELNVNFSLPHGPVLSLDGTVNWVREYNSTRPDQAPGMGIRFTHISREDEEHINRYISQHDPLFYDNE